jgi:glycosyltransferase involved in cell wall biosynthesis
MKKIKVYLQKPWRFSEDSPYYTSLMENPPKNVEFIQEKRFEFAQNKKKFLGIDKIKNIVRFFVRRFNSSIPNARLTLNSEKYDLIHCERCMSKNNKPWVCDLEWVKQFWVGAKSGPIREPSKERVYKILSNKNCKRIMAWTEWAKKEIVEAFPRIKNKVVVIYPAIETQTIKKKKEDKKIRLLFVARRFYLKGGLYSLEVMDRIAKKYKNVEGLVISDIPKEVMKRYEQNPRIKMMPMIGRKKLFEEIYPQTDIFVYPSFIDSFGFAIVEAMSFGLPVVSAAGGPRKEIIEPGKTGFVVGDESKIILSNEYLENLKDEELLQDLQEKTEVLIKDKKLREKMSRNGLKEIESGKFSIKTRNRKLEKIYQAAVK